METLSEYHYKENRIAELELLLKKANRLVVVWKHKYKKIADKHEVKTAPLVSRGEKALIMIGEVRGTGRNSVLIREVAKKCFLSEQRVKGIWYGNEKSTNHTNN